MSVELLTEHHLELSSLNVGRTVSSKSTFLQNVTLLEITCHGSYVYYYSLHDLASGSDITPCNQIDKPLVVY